MEKEVIDKLFDTKEKRGGKKEDSIGCIEEM